MEKIQGKVNQILRLLAKTMVDKDEKAWPPDCAYFLYQPVRPQRANSISQVTDNIYSKSELKVASDN